MAKRKNTGRARPSSGIKNWEAKKQRVAGVDFGIKPTVMALGDIEFPALLQKNFKALVYAEVEEQTEGGIIVLRPGLGVGFDDLETAKNCFKKFNAWIDGSRDAAALVMSFVDLDEGGYALCIYQEPNALLDRCIPESRRAFIDPLMTFVGHIKKFPTQSKGYIWFKSKAASTMVVVQPISHTADLSDLSFHKSNVNFYTESSVPDESMEASLLRGKNMEEGEHNIRRERYIPNAGQIFEHRRLCQSRFFPVTVEKISLSRELKGVRLTLLEGGYREWQIQQAMCVIALRHKAPSLFTRLASGHHAGAASIQGAILDHLMSNLEDALTTTVPDMEMTAASIKEQIEANSEALLMYFTRATAVSARVELQEELERHGLLDRLVSK